MKTTLEPEDLDLIASRVLELLRPLFRDHQEVKPEKKFFTVKSLAEYLGVSIDWVYKQASNGTIPYLKVGRYIRFRKSAIERWLATRSIQPIMEI